MTTKVVTLTQKPRLAEYEAATDIWPAQIDLRLSGIERMMRRLEWQVWGLVCAAGGLLTLEIMNRVAAQ